LKYKKGFSSRLITKLKATENGILLNGKFARTVDLIKAGDILTVTVPNGNSQIEPILSELDIIYEDDDILVINKSPYLAMHPSHNHQGDTLANAVAAHLEKEGKACTFRAVGRLDKGTSGLVVCALNSLAACKLSGKIKKEYYAIVKGNLEGAGTVDVPIYRPDPMKTLRACSYELGKENAVTHWTVLENYSDATLVKLNLETGRTHQIRVHMAYIGHPLAGDSFYGDFYPEFNHQLLHCGKCEFIHPVTNEKVTFEANPPREFDFFKNA
jgi:23S rRNA pseudouridine1911/1915/1917 synthase